MIVSIEQVMDKRLKCCCCIPWCLSATPPPAVWCRLVVQVQCGLTVCDPYHMIIRLITAHWFPWRTPEFPEGISPPERKGREEQNIEGLDHLTCVNMQLVFRPQCRLHGLRCLWWLTESAVGSSVSLSLPVCFLLCVITLLHVERMPSHILPI